MGGGMRRDEYRERNLLQLTLLALLLGLVTGVGAVLFRDLINVLHNLFFAGTLSIHYNANEFTAPSRWGPFVILSPVVGAIVVTFVVANFAPEAKGHGVPEVMDAIYYNEGVIRPAVVLVKSLASAFAIGSGSSVGREGPIIQIGSAIGSTLGQLIRVPPGQRITLVAAGAGAGIASTFNTPIGGVMFAVELMLPEMSVATFLPVAIATGAATFVGRWFFGPQPAFLVPPMESLGTDARTVAVLVLFAVLGCIIGVAAAGFIRGLHLVEDLFDKIPGRYIRHIIGMAGVGILMLVLFRYFGQYYVDGVGYVTIQSILTGGTTLPWLLGLLFPVQAVGHLAKSGLRFVGRHLLAVALHGRDAGRRFRGPADGVGPANAPEHTDLRHGGHGRHGRRRHRRGDDRGDDDIRDDARLRHRHADDPGGRQ